MKPVGLFDYQIISIHAPRVGSDSYRQQMVAQPHLFLSTLPAWGATPRCPAANGHLSIISIHAPRVGSDVFTLQNFTGALKISIHAPRVGSDDAVFSSDSQVSNFYPRSPRGERLSNSQQEDNVYAFLSTLPAWGATSCRSGRSNGFLISIHAPRVGSDRRRKPSPC